MGRHGSAIGELAVQIRQQPNDYQASECPPTR